MHTLQSNFIDPPAIARPHTWWHWNNGHISREGITADLEAIAAVGIAGVQLFYPSVTIPHGPVAFGSPEWHALVLHAARECKRLGLEFCMHNCPGWSSSGGPWIKPEHAMKVLTSADVRVQGPCRFNAVLPVPPSRLEFYRDVAVLAFRTPEPEQTPAPLPIRATTATGADASAVFDGDPATFVDLERATAEHPCYLELVFDRPISVRTLTFQAPGLFWWINQGRLEASDDGKTFREVAPFSFAFGFETRVVTFPRVCASIFRLVLTDVASSVENIRFAAVELSDRLGITELAQKAFVTRDHGTPPDWDRASSTVTVEAGDVVLADEVVDLTGVMDAEGRLDWQVPEGDWTIQRVGYTLTGRRNGPAPIGGVGLECDKLSPAGIEAHWAGWLHGLVNGVKAGGGRFDGLVIDSYEVGSQNWTEGLEAQFIRRRGYALTPYLPVFSGRVVTSPEATERFLWDFRRTVADLFAEKYVGRFAELAHAEGLRFYLEPYGSGPSDDLQYGAQADVPMCEFWADGVLTAGNAKLAASIGHVHGKPIIGAEAFTSMTGRWQRDPFALKMQADLAFTHGVNRLIFHTCPHQPWVDPLRLPGVTLGNIGTHFGRQVTWWSRSGPFMDYLARCQYLLQGGVFVADFCFYTGGGAPWRMPEADYPAGFDFDFFGTEALLQMTVVEGRLVLPSGIHYRVLVLPERGTLPVNALRKIVELAAAGAIIVGWNQKRVAGFADAAAEAGLLAIAAKTAALPTVFASLDDAVAASKLRPDFASDDASITFIHHSIGEADVYYVASSNPQAHRAHCEFRVTGRLPEFWHPDSGQIEDVADWEVRNGRTRVAVPFDPVGSVFVVFRTPTTLRRSHPRSEPTVQEVSIKGPWQVAFQKGRGAPESIMLQRLISWTDHPDAGVRYFSGEATYCCAFRHEAARGQGTRALIDLGAVANLCEVRLNGIALGIRWKPPFCVDATEALKLGENMLEVDVVNLWPNRLIGDERLEEDAEWKGPRLMEVPAWLLEGRPSPTGRVTFATWKNWKPDDPLLPSGLFGPVRLLLEASAPRDCVAKKL